MLLKSSLNLYIVFLEILSTLCRRFFDSVFKIWGEGFKLSLQQFFQMRCCFLKFWYPLSQIYFSPNMYVVLLHFRNNEKGKGIDIMHGCRRRCGDGHLIKSEFTAGNKNSYLQIVAKSNLNRHQKH